MYNVALLLKGLEIPDLVYLFYLVLWGILGLKSFVLFIDMMTLDFLRQAVLPVYSIRERFTISCSDMQLKFQICKCFPCVLFLLPVFLFSPSLSMSCKQLEELTYYAPFSKKVMVEANKMERGQQASFAKLENVQLQLVF